MPFLLISQSLILPLTLSFLLYRADLQQVWIRNVGLLLIWLVAYFWIRGSDPLLLNEALDWLWPFSIFILLNAFISPLYLRKLVYVFLIILSFIIYVWPVIRFQFNAALIIEIITPILASLVIFFVPGRNSLNNPALVISTSAGGLALVSTFGGSLLIGQLAGALAATGGAYAYFELLRRETSLKSEFKPELKLSPPQFTILLFIYLSLLLIGRVYAELPIIPVALLVVSPLCVVLTPLRFNWLISTSLSITALTWVLYTTSNSSYY